MAKDNKNLKDGDSDLVFAGVIGAVAGAVASIITTSLIDKSTRKNVGGVLKNITSYAAGSLKELKDLADEADDKIVSDKKSPKLKQ